MRHHAYRRILATVGGLLAVTTARAQDVDTLDLSGSLHDRRGTLQVTTPDLGSPDAFYTGLGVVLTKDPLVLEYENGAEQVVIGNRVSTRFAGGYTFGDRGRVDVAAPVYPSVVVEGESHFAMGDVRIGGLFPIHATDDGPVQIGVAPALRLPTAGREAWLTNGSLAAGVTGVAGGWLGDFGWAANLGVDLSRKAELGDQAVGSSLGWGAGIRRPLPEGLVLGAEFDGLVSLADGFGGTFQNPVEWHAYGTRNLDNGLAVTLGAGSGMIAGIGAPKFRVLVGISYRQLPSTAPTDLDGDGILDADDACPREPEDPDGWEDDDGCPDPDNDLDGIIDAEDACPDHAGTVLTQGCPDTDGDGVADHEDSCPETPGPAATEGCPDADGDRVPDFRDDCPDEPADPRVDPTRSDGCPARVFVTREKIEITDRIYFEVDKALIKKRSYDLLQEIAEVIKKNTDIDRVEIQGHTDNTASESYNLDLSQRRAESVKEFLVQEGGVEPDRLETKGYGETQPIDTNRTEEGKARNRRVEFVICSSPEGPCVPDLGGKRKPPPPPPAEKGP